MAGVNVAAAQTPVKPAASAKKLPAQSASTGKQASILGFFTKSSTPSAKPAARSSPPGSSPCLKETTKTKSNAIAVSRPKPDSAAARRSDAEPSSSQENGEASAVKRAVSNLVIASSSPVKKVKKVVSYAESSDEDEDVFATMNKRLGQRRRARPAVKDDDDDDDKDDQDDFKPDANAAADDYDDDDMSDFVVWDESDADAKPKKRKRPSGNNNKSAPTPRKRQHASSSPQRDVEVPEEDEEMLDDLPQTSTAQQWRYDPENPAPPPSNKTSSSGARPTAKPNKPKAKEKAYKKEPEDRYPWLAKIQDIDRRSPDHPDFDKSSIYIPPMAWSKFSPFEKQYWEIKQKLWDTVVFFKKGKFYELYENDATIGHQLFDLKLTDRVNMRMVGVPEASLDVWVNQFVAKGYKVARVDQMESALGKEMRERGNDNNKKPKKEDKIIRRELACILTGGTLVEGSMLQDDMATFCVAIKESVVDDSPAFGIAFVDAATGQFFVSQFQDDVDLTKFETLVAQISPRELLLEKSHISTKALRILKNNTAPTTIWNYLRPDSEFLDAETTRRELSCGEYFVAADGGDQREAWPEVLQQQARDKDLLMSAMGALLHYLRLLKLERSLLSQGRFEWYDPIRRDGTLVLDGQSLINLEVFANSVNGGAEGTLFSLLNRCITPFGKRLFRQWVCHPLCNRQKIEERLDAVDMLNADRSILEQFSSLMSKMPDLERLISRIHAGVCKADDFVRVLEGFEQIEYAMSMLGAFGGGNGLVDRLISAMPDLQEPLTFWKSAFDRKRVREEKLLIPERGIEEDFDGSADHIAQIKKDLYALLDRQRSALKCKNIKFTDVGKEIYQMEVPKATKVPKQWRQMSATSSVKRYYFGELDDLVRQLQEAEETHSQITKDVAARFFKRFDVDYEVWIQAIRIISQLDCLICLAKASSSLGEPSCRPTFVDDERSVVEFRELRHPCMLNTVDDFIPNDVKLGGDDANINLLTGANAAGKSTVLRMSCIAVIMAQIGCYVPAKSARLTAVDRIMSRLGANDNIFAAQSTFFVELSETKKILSEATPRSLVILDELGRGTSSYDGVAVAQAVLHHVATHIGCVGFFATHYHSLATEFENHPEIRAKRMQIQVDDQNRRVTFLYRLEDGVAEGSFGMHCAAMCGINPRIIDRAEVAAKEWEHTSRLKESLDRAKTGCYMPLGILSDVASLLRDNDEGESKVGQRGIEVLLRAIEKL